jgi:hypothetical protein
MDPLDELKQSDTVFFSRIAYDLDAPRPLTSGLRERRGRCVEKPVGDLRFALNSTRDLDIQKPFDFDVQFVGKKVGTSGSADLVRWDVNEKIDREFTASGIKVRIDSVKGSLLTTLKTLTDADGNVLRRQGESCRGEPRHFGVTLATAPGVNTLTVSGSVLGSGVQLLAENITVDAEAGRKLGLEAFIHVVRNECGIDGIVPRGIARFWAGVHGVPPGETPRYAWSVSGAGATAIGPTDHWGLSVQLGETADPIDIAVTVTFGSLSTTAKGRHTPDTHQSAFEKNLRCLVQSHLKRNWLVDPLWDPLRDRVAQPYSRQELRQMQFFAEKLLALTTDALELRAPGQKIQSVRASKATAAPRARKASPRGDRR